MKLHCPKVGDLVARNFCDNCNLRLSCGTKELADKDRLKGRIILSIGIAIIILVTLNNYLEIL